MLFNYSCIFCSLCESTDPGLLAIIQLDEHTVPKELDETFPKEVAVSDPSDIDQFSRSNMEEEREVQEILNVPSGIQGCQEESLQGNNSVYYNSAESVEIEHAEKIVGCNDKNTNINTIPHQERYMF